MHRTLLALAVSGCLVAAGSPPAAVSLSNGQLTAQFGDRGLVSLSAPALTSTLRFGGDEFSLTLDGQVIDSRSLPAPTRAVGKDRVSYGWASGAYRIVVDYEMAAGWHFASKTISVTAAPARTFRAGEVKVFDATLAEPINDVYVPKSARPALGTLDYGACLRLDEGRGLLAVAQNPFLVAQAQGKSFAISYKPDLDWSLENGPFVADRGLLALYRMTGRRLPAQMVPEWRMPAGPTGLETPGATATAPPGMDEAEIEAFTGMVRALVLARPARPVNVLVGWCLNDYQIDAGTPEGRAEYKRVIDQASALGAEYVLYAPSDSTLSRREQSVDDWSWEHVLWLGLGQQIRKGEWAPRTSAVPPSTQEMLDYARGRNVKLLAYVYPVLPFSQNPAWLVAAKNNPNRKYANLGFRGLQDWLIETLVAFHDRLGLGGFAFDHTFLTYEGRSRYAQWAGWRRVMEELRRRIPDIVIDGRQAYHQYGPWSWLAGSYPHPTFNDEQPESFVPFPDLHFDRVSADRERFTAYRYRNYEFTPSELVPGFITHQTSRSDDGGGMPERKTEKGVLLTSFRARDWDYLGWRYSLLSSIAIAGWNNVIDMVPARDVEEDKAFGNVAQADRAWFRKWIDWANTNKEYLRHTRTILGQPALGKIDGTSAIVGDRGFIFLFNPNAATTGSLVRLDDSIGVPKNRRFLLKELYPMEGRVIGQVEHGTWASGDEFSVTLDGTSALVLELQPVEGPPSSPVLFNVPGTVTLAQDVLRVEGIRGEAGTTQRVMVVLPAGRAVSLMEVNGRRVEFMREGDIVRAWVQFEGARFGHSQQLAVDTTNGGLNPGEFTGGVLRGRFTVPQRVFDQLAARQKAWPIPWTAEDYRTTWLAPERLLLFVQIAEPDSRWEARLRIDGKVVELRKAYTAVRAAARTFVGFYADLSLISADQAHTFELDLPTMRPGQLRGLFFENVEPEYTDRFTQPRVVAAPTHWGPTHWGRE